MDARTTKSELRSKALAARSQLSPEDRDAKNIAMTDHGLRAISFQPDDVISGFWPIRGEADILHLLDLLRDQGATTCLPVVISQTEIIFRHFIADDELVSGGFGTKAPSPASPEVDPTIMLVPLAAFDAKGQRIGYGAGFYDRAIAKLNKKGVNPRLIGIAFDCQEVPSVPAEKHDIPLDYILTESGCRTLYS